MKTIGIITIHKIHNYGSVLQAYALQHICESLGYKVEIIDYSFPNSFHQNNRYYAHCDTQPNEPQWIKVLFARALIRQHRGINKFIDRFLHLSSRRYANPDELAANAPLYDVYLTGSDQVWSPRHCNGDPSFLLHFAPDGKKRVSYAASIGTGIIPNELRPLYRELLSKYDYISVREDSGRGIIKDLIGCNPQVVLDPTLLLDKEQWNSIAAPRRLVKSKYILCYFLNYSFNAFPYVDSMAVDIQRKTGYKIVRVARPPHHLFLNNTEYRIGASPEEFLALIRDAEIVLTTSFHGTAFAVNYGKPLYTIIQDFASGDSRQVSLMRQLGLENKVLSLADPFPESETYNYDVALEQERLRGLRYQSMNYLEKALKQ